MNISSSVNQTPAYGQLTTTNVSNKANLPIKDSVRSVDPAAIADEEKAQSKNTSATPSLVIDEQAIALLEQSQASLSTQTQPNKTYSSANEDQPSAKNETAIANYQAVGNLAQRESVQKLFGVDLFA
jgi:hypothetical protein